MKIPNKTIYYLSYKLRYFLPVFFLTLCTLSFRGYSASNDSISSTTPSVPQTTRLPSNGTSALPTATPVARTNPCSQIRGNEEAQNSCNTFFNSEVAAGTESTFEQALVVSNARELINAVKTASTKGTIIVLSYNVYTLTEQLVPNQRIALVGVKKGKSLPTIRMTTALTKDSPEVHALVSLKKPAAGASTGFYSSFINWETVIDYSDEDDEAYNILGIGYPGEIRLYGNSFIHKDSNINLDEFISLNTPGNRVVIDSNQFNTSNLHGSSVFSTCSSCGENEHEIIITNNTLTGSDGEENDSNNAFYLAGHKKFTIKNNRALDSLSNASIDIELSNEPGLQASIEGNIASTGATMSHRSILIELDKPFMDALNVTGLLTVSGNDYFDVSYDDDNGYIAFTKGKAIPVSSSSAGVSLSSLSPATTSVQAGSSASTAPAVAKNPCDNLNHDSTARKICNDFLNNAQATGNDRTFSHAFVVTNANELVNKIEHDHLDGTSFTGSIIVLRKGTYLLTRPLRINHKVALVGEKSGTSLPEIKAGNDMLKVHHELDALVQLKESFSESTSGFYSAHIQWETGIDTNIEGVAFNSAISSSSYPGKIRIFDNHFRHQGAKTDVNMYLKLEDSYGDTYIGHNAFDTTYLRQANVNARCTICFDFDPKLEIVSNAISSEQGSERATVSAAFEIRGYKRFWIEKNQQQNTKAAAYIDVKILNNISGLRGSVRDNVVLQETPAEQRKINIETVLRFEDDPLNISGSLVTTPNSYYDIVDLENILAHVGPVTETTATAQTSSATPSTKRSATPPAVSPSQINPTPASITPTSLKSVATSSVIEPAPTQPAIVTSVITPTRDRLDICDHMSSPSGTEVGSSEVEACKTFLKDNKASGGHSFSMAVVVDNATGLDNEVNGDFLPRYANINKLVVLKSGTYQLTYPLNIAHKVALVGIVKDGEYPVIRIADNFSVPVHSSPSLAYLSHNPTVAETGFFSYHIHWNTTTPRHKTMHLHMGAINSQSYRGELRLYENKFSEAMHDYTNHYIQLKNAVGGAYIENNRFDTAYLRTSAIMAFCASDTCERAEPPIEIRNNRFHSRYVGYRRSRPGSMVVRGYTHFRIIGNQQETKDAAGTILIRDHSSVKHMDSYVLNNIAHKEAPEFQRRIVVQSFFPPDQSVYITGKLHVAGNDYYHFEESGLDLKYVDYTVGKQLPSSQVASSQTPASTSSTVEAASSIDVSTDFSVGSVTPTQLLASITASASLPLVKKNPCDDIKEHKAAFDACEAFLKSEQASGPASNKPAFSHAMMLNSSEELLEGIKKQTADDGKAITGRIIVLPSETYELSKALVIKHRVAMVGTKNKHNKVPVIKAADSFSAPTGPSRSLLILKGGTGTSGFYSWNLEWKIAQPAHATYYDYESHIYADRYHGDIRFCQNHFSHEGESVWSRHSILLKHNTGHQYYIGHNTFDTSGMTDNVVKSNPLTGHNHQAAIEIDSNAFQSSKISFLDVAKAVVLNGYERLQVSNNIQKSSDAAGEIDLTFYNFRPITSASVTNNRAHKDAPVASRTIDLKLFKKPYETASAPGYVKVTGNDYYEVDILDLDKKNYHYIAGKRTDDTPSASLVTSTPSVTPSPSYTAAEVTPTPSLRGQASATVNSYSTPQPSPTSKTRPVTSSSVATHRTQPLPQSTSGITTSPLSADTTSSAPPVKSSTPSTKTHAVASTPPVISSPCDQLTHPDIAQICQNFLNELQEMETGATFSEAVVVRTSQELVDEISATSETGKVILLHAGTYVLSKPLHIIKPVALVSIGHAEVKSSGDYPDDADSLVLLDDTGSGHGFYTKYITWDISAFDDLQGHPLSTAVKAVKYDGKLVMNDDDFQYHANRENEKAPSHYIEVQDSSGDVIIADSTFLSVGLEKALIYASCKGCLTEDQSIDIFGNHFIDSNHGESVSAAIDVRYYKSLNIHSNVQGTQSVSAHINIVLPNNKNDINAIIKDNVALSASDKNNRTIDLTIGRLVKEPVDIDGSVKVLNNRCFFVNHNGIPSDILELIQDSCSTSLATNARISPQSSGGMSVGEGIGYAAASFAGAYLTALVVSGAYGRSPLPGHKTAHRIFLKLAWPGLWLYSTLFKSKGYHNPENAEGNELIKFYSGSDAGSLPEGTGAAGDNARLIREEGF